MTVPRGPGTLAGRPDTRIIRLACRGVGDRFFGDYPCGLIFTDGMEYGVANFAARRPFEKRDLAYDLRCKPVVVALAVALGRAAKRRFALL